MLDTFDTSTMPSIMLAGPASAQFVDDPAASVVGARRDTTVTTTAATNMINSIRFEILAGQANYGSGPMADGAVDLFYDGPTLATDLGEAVKAFQVEFMSFDDGFGFGMDVTATVDSAGGSAVLTRHLVGSTLGPFSLSFALSDFSNVGAIDLSALQSIRFEFEPMRGQDFQLTAVEAYVVPEPACWRLGSMALFGLLAGWYRRRR